MPRPRRSPTFFPFARILFPVIPSVYLMCARVVLSYPSFTDVTPQPGGSSSSPEIPCEIGGYESRTRWVSHPPALLSFQYKWATSNSVPAASALFFPDPTIPLSQSHTKWFLSYSRPCTSSSLSSLSPMFSLPPPISAGAPSRTKL